MTAPLELSSGIPAAMSDRPFPITRNAYEHPTHSTSCCCPQCGKVYSTYHHLAAHERACTLSRQNLSELLEQTKEFWEMKRRKRAEINETTMPIRGKGSDRNCRPGSVSFQLSEECTNSSPRIKRRRVTLSPEPVDTPSEQLDAPVAFRKGKRERRAPARYTHDVLPAPPPPLFPTFESPIHDAPIDIAMLEAKIALLSPPAFIPSVVSSDLPVVFVTHESDRSRFGVVKRYSLPPGVLPTHDPDQLATLQNKKTSSQVPTSYGPFGSRTAFLLAEWYWISAKKSFTDFQKLISIIQSPDFSLKDAVDVNWRAAFKSLGANRTELSDTDGSWISDDGWMTATISIDIPFHKRMKQYGTLAFTVGDFHYRSIVSLIKEKLSSRKDGQHFHYYPYEATWRRTPDSPEVELYGELYASRAFRDEHERLQRLPPTFHNKGMERVVVALMFWSDATQLTSFGGASLWPCYLFFGNESKDRRGKPSEGLGHQIAYFMKLPDKLNDYLKEMNEGKLPTSALFTYCARELFHEQWSILLGPEFTNAMKYGIILPCPDGKMRCFFPRIFSYSADYPEKVLIGGLRNNGNSPCHRCLIAKAEISKLGAPSDIERFQNKRSLAHQQEKVTEARKAIQKGYAVDSKTEIEAELQPHGLVPVHTAFASKLSEFNFDVLSVLVVDILHEFEIGVWKRLYTHLLRLLEAFSSQMSVSLVAELDSRLMELLFVCAQWHALAKLRLHNDFTLALLDYTTTHLGAKMRIFDRDTCTKVPTKELQKEAEARARKTARDRKSGATMSTSRRPAALNVFTIKFHYLGDYTSVIRKLGTTDSYSTQTGELYHREPKSWYPRTDRKNYEQQLSQIERRKARLARIRSETETPVPATPILGTQHGTMLFEADHQPADDTLYLRYTIGSNQNRSLSLNCLGRKSIGEEHCDDYLPVRILAIITSAPSPEDSSSTKGVHQWIHILIRDNRLFSHKLLKINYTTYDVRRDQDVLHVETPQSNAMFLNDRYSVETRPAEHPYIYGKLLGVFHADVSFTGTLPDGVQSREFRRIDFAWVHWYEFIGSKNLFSLDRVAPYPLDSDMALDFVDPCDILRGVHLVPHFAFGKADGPAPISDLVHSHHEWKAYYINRFADRDLFMRYQPGMSVGHAYMHTKAFPGPNIPHDFDHGIGSTSPAGRTLLSPVSRLLNHEHQPAGIARDESVPEGDCENSNSLGATEGEGYEWPLESDSENSEAGMADYLDDLDDGEFAIYNDMYEEQGDSSARPRVQEVTFRLQTHVRVFKK
ncbi:hypothetical protein FA13DRAFT_1719017 [Coprinellus micaceus]|uniref:Uncharacterized protein n=1 Tax=Coprinellus micaceus TaxID=71717 RepID=A0A4Y7SCK7_COPMI|nr:hypothetical protein FA13DRAFT_1719017 [Coprinellus micaceus]